MSNLDKALQKFIDNHFNTTDIKFLHWQEGSFGNVFLHYEINGGKNTLHTSWKHILFNVVNFQSNE